MPQFPFHKVATPHMTVMRLDELIHAKDLQQCLEHSKRISCFSYYFLFLTSRYSCCSGLNPHAASQRGLPTPGTEAEEGAAPCHSLVPVYLLHTALTMVWSDLARVCGYGDVYVRVSVPADGSHCWSGHCSRLSGPPQAFHIYLGA